MMMGRGYCGEMGCCWVRESDAEMLSCGVKGCCEEMESFEARMNVGAKECCGEMECLDANFAKNGGKKWKTDGVSVQEIVWEILLIVRDMLLLWLTALLLVITGLELQALAMASFCQHHLLAV